MGTRFSLATEPMLNAAQLDAFRSVFDGDGSPDDYGCYFTSWSNTSYEGGLDTAISMLADVAKRLPGERTPTGDMIWISVAILSDEGPPICVAVTANNIKLLLGTPENAEHVAAYRKHCGGEARVNPEGVAEIKIPLV
jgi:hypothetical protein